MAGIGSGSGGYSSALASPRLAVGAASPYLRASSPSQVSWFAYKEVWVWGIRGSNAAGRRPGRPSAASTTRAMAVPSAAAGSDSFGPAISLGSFSALDRSIELRDGSFFEWVNKEEIKAGETTCGFLHAPLSWPNAEETMAFPGVKVYVCVKFATEQPAPRGNLAVHCGGPGSLSNCVYNMGGKAKLGEVAATTYNVIAFDQRGMGRSKPSFYAEECAVTDEQINALNTLDISDEETIRNFARAYKERNLRCWNYEGFRLEKKQSDGDVKTFHFLEYSGTRQLAEDIERVRLLFGDQKLSVYGISYGTAVIGTYVTVFPDNMNLMVLDGCQYPVSDLIPNALDDAEGINKRIDFFVASCEMNGGGHCGVSDLGTCLKDLHQLIGDNAEDLEDFAKDRGFDPTPDLFLDMVDELMSDLEKIPEFCVVAASKDVDALKELFPEDDNEDEEDEDSPDKRRTVGRQAGLECLVNGKYGCDSKPSRDDKSGLGYEDGTAYNINLHLVRSQDYSFGIYRTESLILWWNLVENSQGRALKNQVRLAGLSIQLLRATPHTRLCDPAKSLAGALVGGYYVPNTTPLVPMGNPLQTGIIAGQLYDYATPYLGSQLMRQNFPLASLLTSRSVNHGLDVARAAGNKTDPVCQGHVQRYFKTGAVDFVDGHVCESEPINDSCTILNVLSGEGCKGRKLRGSRRLKVERGRQPRNIRSRLGPPYGSRVFATMAVHQTSRSIGPSHKLHLQRHQTAHPNDSFPSRRSPGAHSTLPLDDPDGTHSGPTACIHGHRLPLDPSAAVDASTPVRRREVRRRETPRRPDGPPAHGAVAPHPVRGREAEADVAEDVSAVRDVRDGGTGGEAYPAPRPGGRRPVAAAVAVVLPPANPEESGETAGESRRGRAAASVAPPAARPAGSSRRWTSPPPRRGRGAPPSPS
ncbi:hypothetical protein THAOC_31214 [Thalassiosira oceanica]|uniref:AB hydrolase-1 domain-containing protein n=1 Tax=Thalassiosira oceanica TaxID=159749 RepID=K0RLR1_THAOC|nr:hypothetical protein THAOC_31214 [Thalassiosira oceanica]|eukprot:EJK49871.1 hypothetical protein THAOC_31214 [Thalassiosira oceanica]